MIKNGAPTSVGTSNQPEQSDAVRPRIAFRQRDSETPSPSREAGHEKNSIVAEWRVLPAETSGYGGWNRCPLTGGAGKRGVGTRLCLATWFKSTGAPPPQKQAPNA